MKVAFTSTDGEKVDEHFGKVANFYVWEIGPDRAEFLEKVSAITTADDEDDRINARANALVGCVIVYTRQIGGPAAAKLVARRIHPLKTASDIPITDVVGQLQQVLKGTPPPWLRKAMGEGALS